MSVYTSAKKWFRSRFVSEDEERILATAKQMIAMRRWGITPEEFPLTEIKGVGPKYIYMRGYGAQRPTNDRELRKVAATPTPAACVQRLVNDFVSTPWKIVPVNPKKPDDKRLNTIEQKFYNPNEHNESFDQIRAMFVRDILEIDAGVITKSYAARGNRAMTQFFARDGSSFLKELDESGHFGRFYEGEHTFTVSVGKKGTAVRKIRNKTIGYWQHAKYKTVPIPFEPFEVVYGCQNPLSYRNYGQSKVEVLDLRLKTLMQSDISTELYFRSGEIRKAILGTEEAIADDSDWKRHKDRLSESLKETPFNIIPIDQKVTIQPLTMSRRDMQWFEQQKEYRLSVLSLFNVPPVLLGWTERDLTQATDESQREVYLRKGLWPLLRLFEYQMNMGIISEFFVNTDEHKGPFAGATPDCIYTHDLYDPIEEKRWLERCEIAAKGGFKRINEMRAERRLPPLPWGDLNPAALLAIQQFAQGHFMAPDVITLKIFTLLTGIPTEEQAEKMLKQFTPPSEEDRGQEPEDYWKNKWEAYKKARGMT